MRRKLLKQTMAILVLIAFFVIPIGISFSQFPPGMVVINGPNPRILHKCDDPHIGTWTQNPCDLNPWFACIGRVQTVNVSHGQCDFTGYEYDVCNEYTVAYPHGVIPCILVANAGKLVCTAANVNPQQFTLCI